MRAVSLYSGAGGLDWGFRSAGLDVVHACELDADACATLRLNFPGLRVHQSRVSDFVEDVLRPGCCDVVFGGPPCQGYSVAGKMSPDDPRSAEVSRFLSAVSKAAPSAFLMENVDTLATLDRFDGVLRAVRVEAAAMGYATHAAVLNAADYGVPQSRRRLFLFGARGLDEASIAAACGAVLDARRRRGGTVRDVLAAFDRADTLFNPLTCWAKITYAKVPVLRRSPYAGLLFNGAGRPLALDAPAPTMAAATGGNKTHFVDEDEMFRGKPSYVEAYHARLWKGGKPRVGTLPRRLRRLTLTESAAFQTFDPRFAFAGPKSSRYRQVGNAVPCLLASVVAECVTHVLAAPVRAAA